MTSKPNILLIITDQQRADSLSCYGSSFTHTPNLDRLAREGIKFERAYCPNPVCTPSRASLFSGKYLSRHGVWNIGMNIPADEKLISHYLKEAGYRTHYVGKTHFQPMWGQPDKSIETLHNNDYYPAFRGPFYGFDTLELAVGHATYGLTSGHYAEWVKAQVSEVEYNSFKEATRLSECYFGGEAYDWALPLRLHNSVWTAECTIDFLEKQSGDKPFFLVAGFQDPHHPHCVPLEFEDRVDPNAIPMPDFMPNELEDKPRHFLEAHLGQLKTSKQRGAYDIAGQGGNKTPYGQVSEKDARLGRAYYYNLVKLIDREVGRMLACLDRSGQAENTLVIFTTDHGELLGDHGLWMKGPFHYEQLLRIPFLMRWPQGFEGGKAIKALFSHVDILPTILAAAGLSQPEGLDGVNALPLLRNELSSIRENVLVECVDDPNGLRLKTLVTENLKLTRYAGQDYGELYHLEQDSHERLNLWNDPKYYPDRMRLLEKLLDLMEPLEKRVERYCYA